MKIKHIVAGGCSFTADGIGGMPPRADHPGACSFLHGAEPRTWVGHVARDLEVTSLVNVAAGSHGNMVTRQAISHVLQNNAYDPQDTMVLLNITETVRLDAVCDWYQGNQSKWIPWESDLVPWTYFSRDSMDVLKHVKSMDIDTIQLVSSIFIKHLFEDLTSQGYQFRYLLMKDIAKDAGLAAVLAPYQHNQIRLPGRPDMWGFCREYGYLDTDGFHPDADGHRVMAQQVLNQIQ